MFKSKAQMAWLLTNKPEVGEEWLAKYGPYKGKLKHVKGKKK